MRLTTTAPKRGARILALGTYLPAGCLTNDDLSLDDAWVRSRTGIVTRHVADAEESVVAMAAMAGEKALASAGMSPEDVDVVMLATCSMPSPMPNGAASVAARLGMSCTGAFDLNAACSGFSYGLALADGLVRAGTARHVMLIGAERMRDWVDPDDSSTTAIFADGAGAALVGPSAHPSIGPVVWGSDGRHAQLIRIPAERRTIVMEGPSVFRWAITTLMPAAVNACRRAGVRPQDLAAFVPHQANLRIIEVLARQLGAPNAEVATDVVKIGNTSAASIPIALAGLKNGNRVSVGQPVLLVGFGAGLTYAAQVINCP